VSILLGVTVAIVAATCLFIASTLRFRSREYHDLLQTVRAQIDDQAKRTADLEVMYGTWRDDRRAFDEVISSLQQMVNDVQARLHRIESLTISNEQEIEKVKAQLGTQRGPGH
jgi:peptidoglycan hydrolase CwlO-like protein